jgi:2-dehydropantoate 2-reductase
MVRLFRECSSVAEGSGFAPRSPYVELAMGMLNTVGSPFKASMLRDIERGGITEDEHVLGDMVARARAAGISTPILELARVHVAACEICRSRAA